MFTHIDDQNYPSMVDVGEKSETLRCAVAHCYVDMPEKILEQFDGKEIQSKKGPVFSTAIVAGTMAVKKTSDLIPFCHPLLIENIKLNISLEGERVSITCKVEMSGKTGVEMEALMGAQIAALTIYDMCKALSHDIVISDLKLMKKSGGKRDFIRERV